MDKRQQAGPGERKRDQLSTIWSTPRALFNELHREFRFALDACADPENAKCRHYFSRDNALNLDWRGNVFLNPPYGRGVIRPWLKKAFESSSHEGTIVVSLIPAHTNSPWWHDFALRAHEIRFILHKLRFDADDSEEKSGVPFWGSAIIVWRWDSFDHPRVSSYRQPDRLRKV